MSSRSRQRTALAIVGAFLVPALLGIAALVLRGSGWISSLEQQERRQAETALAEVRDRWSRSLRDERWTEFEVARDATGAPGAPFVRAPAPFLVEGADSGTGSSASAAEASTDELLRELGRGYAEAGVTDLALSCFDRAFAAVRDAPTEEARSAVLAAWSTDQLLAGAESFARAGRSVDASSLRRFLCEARKDEWRDLVSVPVLASIRAIDWPGTDAEVTARRTGLREELLSGSLPIDARTVGILADRFGLETSARQAFEAAGKAVRTEVCPQLGVDGFEALPDGSIVVTESERFRFVGATTVGELLGSALESVRIAGDFDPMVVRLTGSIEDSTPAREVLARSESPALAVVPTAALPSDRIESVSLYLGLAALGTLVLGQLLVWRVVRREVALTRLKSDFVDLVSHELRTPLAALTIKTEMLAHGGVPDHKRDRYGLDIHRSILRLGSLVEEVLDFARLEKGQTGPALRPESVRVVLAEGLRRSRESLRAVGSKIRCEVPRSLPEVLVDLPLAARAIRNLLDNAAKHAPGGTVRVSAELESERTRPKLRLVVEDEGPGFGDGDPARLFEPFQRRQAPGSSVRGSGLGLAIVSEVARVHGGRVEAENRSDRPGSRVTLWLPTVPENDRRAR